MPMTKDWTWLVAIERYMSARSGSKYERLLTEELASIKTENSDTVCDVTKELASLKTDNNDIVQGSLNLVTLK